MGCHLLYRRCNLRGINPVMLGKRTQNNIKSVASRFKPYGLGCQRFYKLYDLVNDQIVKLIESLTAKSIRLEARCDALDVVLCALAKHHGIDPAKVAAAVEKMTSHYHQKRLE